MALIDVTQFQGFLPHFETDHTETNMSQIIGTAIFSGSIDGEYLAYIEYGLRPEDHSSSANIVRAAAQVWVNAGGVIPQYSTVITNEMVNAERARRILAGKVINGMLVTGSQADQMNLTNLGAYAKLLVDQSSVATITFRDGNNINHDLTPAQMLQVWEAGVSYISAVYKASWDLKDMGTIPIDYTNDSYWPS